MTSGYVCTSCGAACAADTHEPKCRCGGLFELDFTPPAWDSIIVIFLGLVSSGT